MGVQPPFLYDRPQRYSFVGPTDKQFDPRAVTRASWTSLPAAPRPNGPLIDTRELNRHPDTYFQAPYGNLNWKPMSPNTKSTVTWLRGVLLLLRILSLFGAMGLLFCIVSILDTGNTLDWIIRVPPGVILLHDIYAIYHLSRSANGRTPASSASYMIFAAIIDTGLIPFFVFAAMVSHNQEALPIGDVLKWWTRLNTQLATDIITESVFIISVALGSLHLIALALSITLAVVFKKIDNLPPDMNPLESNLTSRHKRNKSSLSLAMSEALISRDSHLSSPLMDEPRKPVPFMHTRNNSSNSMPVLSGNISPQRSPQRQYDNSPSPGRNSRPNMPRAAYAPVPCAEMGQSPRATQYYQPNMQQRPRPISYPSIPPHHHASPQHHASPPSPTRAPPPAPPTVPSHSPSCSSERSSSVHSITSASSASTTPNWETIPSPPPELQHLREAERRNKENAKPHNLLLDHARTPDPLGMNPPTPPIPSSSNTAGTPKRRALVPVTGNETGNSSPATWEEINFNQNAMKTLVGVKPLSENESQDIGTVGSKIRFYGGLRGNRVASTGAEREKRSWIRRREVSGKVAEEGRAE